jgi:hypothetical protein
MFEASVAKVAFIFPFGLAVGFMLWVLWNLHKQNKRGR